MAMTLRTSEHDDRLIEEIAAAHGTSKNEAVLRAVRAEAERAGRREGLDASIDKLQHRYGDLLRRLGE
jgi:hypothetical protein